MTTTTRVLGDFSQESWSWQEFIWEAKDEQDNFIIIDTTKRNVAKTTL